METNTLYENKWVSLRERDGYVFGHETSCDGEKVAVLPYRFTEGGNIEFLVREELTPAWGEEDETFLNSITGGVEDTPWDTARKELLEETGYEALKSSLWRYMGVCAGSKAMSTWYSLYCVDLTGLEPVGDGSGEGELEAKEKSYWIAKRGLLEYANDPILYTLLAKFEFDVKPWLDRKPLALNGV